MLAVTVTLRLGSERWNRFLNNTNTLEKKKQTNWSIDAKIKIFNINKINFMVFS